MLRKPASEDLRTLRARYQRESRQGKRDILNEFSKLYGYSRKYAICCLNKPCNDSPKPRKKPHRHVTYAVKTIYILERIWEASGYPWSARLRALIPVWMPWIRKRYKVDPKTKRELLTISASQIDRRLRSRRINIKRKQYGIARPGTILKRMHMASISVPEAAEAGRLIIDTVVHHETKLDYGLIYTLKCTDAKTGWLECVAIAGRSQKEVFDGLLDIKNSLPFSLKRIDSRNGNEFANNCFRKFCAHLSPPIEYVRDEESGTQSTSQARDYDWVRIWKVLGLDQNHNQDIVSAINDLYQNDLRLWYNLFQPYVKLVRKVYRRSRLVREHDLPRTSYERLLECKEADREKLNDLRKLQKSVDPFELSKSINRKVKAIYQIAAQKFGMDNRFYLFPTPSFEETKVDQRPRV